VRPSAQARARRPASLARIHGRTRLLHPAQPPALHAGHGDERSNVEWIVGNRLCVALALTGLVCALVALRK
jgi:hypothetical protein